MSHLLQFPWDTADLKSSYMKSRNVFYGQAKKKSSTRPASASACVGRNADMFQKRFSYSDFTRVLAVYYVNIKISY